MRLRYEAVRKRTTGTRTVFIRDWGGFFGTEDRIHMIQQSDNKCSVEVMRRGVLHGIHTGRLKR